MEMAENQSENSGTTPRWSVVDFTFIKAEQYARIVVMCDHVCYVIQLRLWALRSSPILQQRFAFFLDVAEKTKVDGYTIKDFYDWAVQPLLPILHEYADPAPRPRVMVPTLRDFLHAAIMEYILEARSDTLVLESIRESDDTRFMFGVRRQGISSSWPRYLPVSIRVDDQDGLYTVPRKVLLPNGTHAFFKLVRAGDGAALDAALASYSKMRAVQLKEWIRVPRLLGLVVRGDDSDVILGLLLTYVAIGASSLRLEVENGAPEHSRRRWVAQARLIMNALHDNELVWSGTGPDNVLIDTDQNAWLVGFEAGQPSGWVPSERAGTKEGDLEVMEQLIEYAGGVLPYYY